MSLGAGPGQVHDLEAVDAPIEQVEAERPGTVALLAIPGNRLPARRGELLPGRAEEALLVVRTPGAAGSEEVGDPGEAGLGGGPGLGFHLRGIGRLVHQPCALDRSVEDRGLERGQHGRRLLRVQRFRQPQDGPVHVLGDRDAGVLGPAGIDVR